MKSTYKQCRYKGKRMRKHRAILLAIITDEWGLSNDAEIKDCMSRMTIHHIDGNKRNNERRNLQIMTKRAHDSLHAKRRERNSNGRFV